MKDCKWELGDEPPMGESGKWTEDVITITNYGNLNMLSYFNGGSGGCWQRLKSFFKDEEVSLWSYNPLDKG